MIVDDGPIEAEGYDIGEEPKVSIIDVLANDRARPASSGPLYVSGFEDVSRRALSIVDGKEEGHLDEELEQSTPNASQKRQGQRDDRRYFNDPNRAQREEDKERAQKTNQASSRGNRATDPYDDSQGQRDYGARREATRVRRCERTGAGCRYSGPNSECYNDCVDDIGSRGAARNNPDGGQRVDQECSRQCRFIDLRKQRHRYQQQLNELSTPMSYSNIGGGIPVPSPRPVSSLQDPCFPIGSLCPPPTVFPPTSPRTRE